MLLEDNNSFFSYLINNSFDKVAVINKASTIVYTNKSWRELFTEDTRNIKEIYRKVEIISYFLEKP